MNVLSFQEKKEGRENEKNSIKRKKRKQALTAKVWSPAERPQSSGKTKTDSSSRREKPKRNNRNRYQSALYTRGSCEVIVDS